MEPSAPAQLRAVRAAALVLAATAISVGVFFTIDSVVHDHVAATATGDWAAFNAGLSGFIYGLGTAAITFLALMSIITARFVTRGKRAFAFIASVIAAVIAVNTVEGPTTRSVWRVLLCFAAFVLPALSVGLVLGAF